MNKSICESGMLFVADNAFHIEKSPQYKKLSHSVKTVEFIRTRGKQLLFVEAKSSFPNPHNQMPNKTKGNKTVQNLFRKEIADICEKFTHSLNLYSAVDIGVTKDRFPSDYIPADKVRLIFILVIKEFEMAWCDVIERALKLHFNESVCMTQIWKPKVMVINNENAVRRNITVN
jgi:hypothetical protein